jgi:predicted amidohydrolase YtcJ
MPYVRNSVVLFCLLALIACNKKEQADLIITHARIYSCDSAFSIYEAMAIRDGKILALGTNAEIKSRYKTKTEKDALGQVMIPGLIDAHSHFLGYGKSLYELNLTGTHSFDEVLERLTEYAKSHPEGWICGRGWDQNDWADKNYPDRSKLDELFPERPVFIKRVDGHAALANGKALALAGINKAFTLTGGEIVSRTNQDSPSGILIDNAVELVDKVIPPPSKDKFLNYIRLAQKNCINKGLTAVCDAGLDTRSIQALLNAEKDGLLKIGIYAMHEAKASNIDSILQAGIYKSAQLNIRSLKVYADGALGSRGACMKKEYHDRKGHYGFLLKSPDSLEWFAAKIAGTEFQMNTHCIGDSANKFILDLAAKYLKNKKDHRWRIEHAQVIDPADMPLFRKTGVVPSMQPVHATSDMYWAEKRLGKTRMKGAYACKDMLKNFGWLPAGSDFPVESIDPMHGIHAAVTRRDTLGRPGERFMPEQTFSRKEALLAFTLWAAKGCFWEKERGSLEAGKRADFLFLNQDLMNCPENEIFKTKVLETYIAGEKTH